MAVAMVMAVAVAVAVAIVAAQKDTKIARYIGFISAKTVTTFVKLR